MDHRLIAHTKVTPALRRSDTLARPRLLRWLAERTDRRLCLIVAEAGYGKTTLLADYSSHSSRRCLWFKVDEHEGDWVTFTNYVVAALREARPDFGAATQALLGQVLTTDPPRQLVIDTLLAEVSGLDDVRATFIVDDFHLVDRDPDALEIMSRLVNDGPPGLTFIVSTRRPPELQLGRLMAQGEASTLTTDDLRFSREETCILFRDMYGQPLDPDLLDQIDQRTEGWAASLQLLGSSIRGRSALEIRSLVRSLSGAEGPIYDYLAEEVLDSLSAELRRFVIAASLLERITPGYVVALFVADDDSPDEEAARQWITEVDRLGLASRRGPSSPHRFHPLLRQFLRRHLDRSETPEAIKEIHRRVAHRAERDAWLIACHHYLEAGDVDDAMRVMSDSLLVAAGTGDWGPASSLLGRMPEEPGDAAAQVILALQEMHDQRPDQALERLRAIPVRGLDPTLRGMVRYGLVRGAWLAGDARESEELLHDLTADPETPALLREMADAQMVVMYPGGRHQLDRLSVMLRRLIDRLDEMGLHYFAAVAAHNAMIVEHARGRYDSALQLGSLAVERFEDTGIGRRESADTVGILAGIEFELGHIAAGEQALADALAPNDDPTAFAAAADTLLSIGRVDEARSAAVRVAASADRSPQTPALRSDMAILTMRLVLAAGQEGRVIQMKDDLATRPFGIGAAARRGLVVASATVASGLPEARALASDALETALATGATHWEARARIVDAAARRSAVDLTAAIVEAAALGRLAVSDVAEAIVATLDVFDQAPVQVEEAIAMWPQRWLPLLRRQLEAGLNQRSISAAQLLSRHGGEGDIPLLRAWERRHLRRGQGFRLGQQLALRTSPKLVIHDLGASRLERGGRLVRLVSIRRRAAMLLAYLVARRGRPALREQVLEDIWPDLEPEAGANSLNQTLYFLRRDIEPGYDDAVSVNYLHYEGEILRLDPDLVEVDSWAFHGQATAPDRKAAAADERIDLLVRYEGPFAPEFAYEDWAIDWREQVHTSYLDLVTRTQAQLLSLDRVADAIALTQRALALDPKAIDLERALVWLFSAAGSSSAAAEQYRHYATAHREEMGVEASSFESLVAEGLAAPA